MNLVTIHHHLNDARFGDSHDRLYIYGANFATHPSENENVTYDYDSGEWVYVLEVNPSEDEEPYLVALNDIGIFVTDKDKNGFWVGEQIVRNLV